MLFLLLWFVGKDRGSVGLRQGVAVCGEGLARSQGRFRSGPRPQARYAGCGESGAVEGWKVSRETGSRGRSADCGRRGCGESKMIAFMILLYCCHML